MNRARKLAVGIAVLAMLGIPGSAIAAGQNCVGTTAQMFKAAMRMVAQSGQGAVGDFFTELRTNPEDYPWCA